MPDPTPERAEALRLAESADAYGPEVVDITTWKIARALLATESERAELAEWLERKTQYQEKQADRIAELAREVERADQLREGYYVDAQQQRERAERAEREVEELRGALWGADSALELMTNYLDDLLDRAKAVNEMKERHPNANAGAYALYAQGRLTELVAKLAALSEPTEGGARP